MKRFECDFCYNSFNEYANFVNHIKLNHPGRPIKKNPTGELFL